MPRAPGQPDSEAVLRIKALIRWSEAKAGAIVAGCREERLHFLDLPFYRTGTIAKKPLGEDDVRIVRELVERLQPEQIYVAGDLSDPHGTHRVCAEAIFRACSRSKRAGGRRPEVLLYRGAWQEWAAARDRHRRAAQPERLGAETGRHLPPRIAEGLGLVPRPDDPREFWQRAEDRNRHTADVYNQLGLPEYFAIEGFVRWNGVPI